AVVRPFARGWRVGSQADHLGHRVRLREDHIRRRNRRGDDEETCDNRFQHGASLRIIIRAMRTTARVLGALAALAVSSIPLSSQTQTIRIHADSLLDGAGKSIRNATVVVQGSKITAIESGNAAGATYNLGSLTIVPGLIDVHAHVGWHFDKEGRYAAR